MKPGIKRFFALAAVILFLFGIITGTEAQVPVLKRARENFDFDWQFHKGDITIKKVVKAGGQGGITDVHPAYIKKDTVVNYKDLNSYKYFIPSDRRTLNLPHDWAVEGDFVFDNNLGNQPGVSGYLPTGIGFYRKEFEIPAADIGKKISIEFDGIFRNSIIRK